MHRYENDKDETLVGMLKNGDKAAFTEIYNRHWEKMADYAVRLTRSEEASADIIQELFISLWRRKEVLEIKSTLVAYLMKSTKNLSLKYIEKNISKHNFLERFAAQMNADIMKFDDKISFKQLQEQLNDAIEALPKKMKEVYTLSRDGQLSHKEIAQRLGIAENTVKKQISNALKLIAISLNKRLLSATFILLPCLLK